MWSPCFDVVDRKLCTLNDYHRGFSIWSVFARGTPEHPGLGFALEKRARASCEGIVFTLPYGTLRDDLMPLWEREMWTETYRDVASSESVFARWTVTSCSASLGRVRYATA